MATLKDGGPIRLDAIGPDADRALGLSAERLRRGGLVAFATETVYGLGADADDVAACRRIYEVKGRPSDNPLIVHFASLEAAVDAVGPLGPMGDALAQRFWPGPLTLVVARPAGRLAGAAAGLDTIAVRVPSHPVAHALLVRSGVPVAAPSANRSGRPSTTTADSVIEDLGDAAAAGTDVADIIVLDGGPAAFGVESTVVDVTGTKARVLRYGAISPGAVADCVGALGGDADLRRSPGTRYRHYAPSVPLWLFASDTPDAELAAWMAGRIGPVAVLAPERRLRSLAPLYAGIVGGVRERTLGEEGDTEGNALARDLFSALRWCDRVGARCAVAEMPSGEAGRLPAVKDRLLRAASGRFVPRGD